MCIRDSNATLAAFRHVLETNIGYGDVEETQQVSAVLCHSTTTALQRYDQSAREGKRTQGITSIIRWLGCARPPSIMAPPGTRVVPQGRGKILFFFPSNVPFLFFRRSMFSVLSLPAFALPK